ncbi:MAG TPA: glycoside hydrolase family 172 protein [Phycisphaerae bacterium]|nr:glycoside hydrolase family 172 protein [Phycisphaerae bacterium]
MAVFFSIIVTSAVSAEPITTGSLVREMIDLRRFAEFPSPAYKTVQFSSYDRRSSIPGGPEWFANSDGFGREPVPNFEAVIKEAPENGQGEGEYLICDVKGPGAVVRVWTARIIGRIRLYLDGSDTPVYDGDATEFLQKTWHGWAKAAGIDETVLENTFRQRDAGYYPIPFARGCRMVFVGSHRHVHFYQVQVRLYEPSAQVATFTPADLKTYKADIEHAARVLADPDGQWPRDAAAREVAVDASVPPGKTVELSKLEGPGTIEQLTLKATGERIDGVLRQTVLRVVCDDYPRAQVESPIGDFFGAAPGINPLVSLPFTVRPDGAMTSRFVMPFKNNIRVLADNRGDQDVKIAGSLRTAKYAWNDDTSMYFFGRWRADHNLVACHDNVQDVPYLIARGKGVFVGAGAYLLNPNTIPSSGGNWWGEGDEKVFVDDDVQPSTFGTGSEDYFNYAWSSSDIFQFPYCGQPRNDGPANHGFVTNHRWQIVDAMPFRESFAFYMELYPHGTVPGFSYCRTAYHYARPGMMDDILPIAPEDLRRLELPDGWMPEAAGRVKGVTFHQAEDLAGQLFPTLRKDRFYAGGRLFVWQPKNKGDELTLKLPVPEDGNYHVHIVAGLDDRSGTASVTLDGKDVGLGTLDLYVPYRTLLRDRTSQPVQLAGGNHKLVFRYEGPSPAGPDVKQPVIGLDFLWVQQKK